MFPVVPSHPDFFQLQSEVLEYRKKNKIFEKSISNREGAENFTLFDGPPFKNGSPHYGSLLQSAVKDAIPRFWTMKGKKVPRTRWRDCHGIYIEQKVQKALGLPTNQAIEDFGIEQFIQECYKFTNAQDDERNWIIPNFGRWVDMENAYETMSGNYMESVRHIFKTIYDQGKIYKGKRVSLYSTKLNTAIGNFEVQADNSYAEINDPAITVKFKVQNKNNLTASPFETTEDGGIKVVKCIIKNSEGKVLTYFSKKHWYYHIPWGKVDTWETAEIALNREIQEEIGVDTVSSIYLWSKKNIILWVLYSVDYYEVKITWEPQNTEPEKHGELERYTPEEIITSTNPDMKVLNIIYHIYRQPEQFLNKQSCPIYFLARTTTPWTIPANLALVVHPTLDYAQIWDIKTQEYYILAHDLLSKYYKNPDEYILIYVCKWSDLAGICYVPPFDYYTTDKLSTNQSDSLISLDHSFKVYTADYVTATDGTGIVHTAPEFGEEDFVTGKKHDLYQTNSLDAEGRYTAEIDDMIWLYYRKDDDTVAAGVSNANDEVMRRLTDSWLLFRKESITHTVALCPRTQTPLIYKTQDSWFINTNSIKPQLLAQNEHINRTPASVKYNRFAKSIETAPDRCISRTKYWATPMPVWIAKNIKKYFIFDSDGVLWDTFEDVIQAKIAMWEEENNARNSTIQYASKKPHHSKNHTLSHEQIKEYDDWMFQFGEIMATKNIKLFEEFIKNIQKIDPAKIAIVSSGSNKLINKYIWNMWLNFTHVLCHEDHHSKEEKIDLVCKDWWINYKDVYYFTDTLADYYELKDFLDSNKIIWCAWWYLWAEKLETEIKKSNILYHFDDINSYFNNLKVMWSREDIYNLDQTGSKAIKKITLVRHGKSEHNNQNNKNWHWHDCLWITNLTEEWIKQSEDLVNSLSFDPSQIIYLSPLPRVIQTFAPYIKIKYWFNIVENDIYKKAYSDYKNLWETKQLTNIDLVKKYIYKVTDNIYIDFRLAETYIPDYQWWNVPYELYNRSDNPIWWWDSTMSCFEKAKSFYNEVMANNNTNNIIIWWHWWPLRMIDKCISDYDYNTKQKWKALWYAKPKTIYIDGKTGLEFDFHRPYIDNIWGQEWGRKYMRTSEVLDPWMDSGSMPFAQLHYPFENADKFAAGFPADFIGEAEWQIRCWFQMMHTISVLMTGQNAYKNVICSGTIMWNDGRKMSKSYGNYPDIRPSIQSYGADAIRMSLFNSSVLSGGSVAINEEVFKEVLRKIHLPLRNAYAFFTTYANIDQFVPTKHSIHDFQWVVYTNDLDEWIISKLALLIDAVDTAMLAYDIQSAVRPITLFIEDLTNRYIRRNRRRFWKSENDSDKMSGYDVLYVVLVELCKVLSPFMPFLSEHIYRNLTWNESVHLTDRTE